MGPLISLFWTSGDVCPGLQGQGGFLVCFLTWVILRFTSGVTPADCIGVNMIAEPFYHVLVDVSINIGRDLGLGPMTIHATCSKHSTVNHSTTPAHLVSFLLFRVLYLTMHIFDINFDILTHNLLLKPPQPVTEMSESNFRQILYVYKITYFMCDIEMK